MKPYPVVKSPAKILKEICEPVQLTVFEDPKSGKKLREKCSRMMVTLMRANAIGLAANQVGFKDRIIAIKTIGQGMPPGGYMGVMVNPEIILFTGTSRGQEGCLSFPGETVTVERLSEIEVKFWTPDGVQKRMKFSGITSVCIQHEIDHLNGITFKDRGDGIKT